MVFKNEKGFSLIEIVVSLSILSILLLAIPNLMLNAEKIKNEYKYNITIDKHAKSIVDNAIANETLEKNNVSLNDGTTYSIDIVNYNENIDKYIFTFHKKSYVKKYYLLKQN